MKVAHAEGSALNGSWIVEACGDAVYCGAVRVLICTSQEMLGHIHIHVVLPCLCVECKYRHTRIYIYIIYIYIYTHTYTCTGASPKQCMAIHPNPSKAAAYLLSKLSVNPGSSPNPPDPPNPQSPPNPPSPQPPQPPQALPTPQAPQTPHTLQILQTLQLSSPSSPSLIQVPQLPQTHQPPQPKPNHHNTKPHLGRAQTPQWLPGPSSCCRDSAPGVWTSCGATHSLCVERGSHVGSRFSTGGGELGSCWASKRSPTRRAVATFRGSQSSCRSHELHEHNATRLEHGE